MAGPNQPYTQLDSNQVLRQSFDPATDRLRVDAELTSTIIPPPGLEVSILAVDDNIAIRNTNNNNELLINPDGSINVDATITTGPPKNINSLFAAITSVPSSVLTTILSYTVPVSKTDFMGFIEVSGTNIAQYEVYINTVLNARQYTYFGGELNAKFNYDFDQELGYKLNAGDNVQVKVIHVRPYVGDFNARFVYAE